MRTEYELEVAQFSDPIERYSKRHALVKKFAWAIPSIEAIQECVKHSPIVEIGAGKGYWGKLIQEFGGIIVCYDAYPEKAGFPFSEVCEPTWIDVKKGDETSVLNHQDHTLMLCWPPYSTSMAQNALSLYTGKKLIYIGEGWRGCTGDDIFHEMLKNDWKLILELDIPQYYGIRDSFHLYERK